MIFCSILLSVFMQASVVAICNDTPLDTGFEYCKLDYKVIKKIPFNEPDFRIFCWALLDYYECVEKFRKHSWDNKYDRLLSILSNAEDFLRNKLCQMTRLHKRYLKHMKCFKASKEFYKSCQEYAKRSILEYYEQKNTLEPQWIDTRKCLVASISLNCLGKKIENRCGLEAGALYLEILEKTKYLLSVCPQDRFIYARHGASLNSKPIDERPECNRRSCYDDP